MTHPEYVLTGLLMIFFVLSSIVNGAATLVILVAPECKTKGLATLTMFLTCVSLAFAIAIGVVFDGGFMGAK